MAISKKSPSPQEIKTSPHSFSQEELTNLKKLRTEISQLTFEFGILMINKVKLKEEEILLKNKLVELEKQENTLAKSLSKKYGKGSINLDSGTFTPIE